MLFNNSKLISTEGDSQYASLSENVHIQDIFSGFK